MSKYGRAKHRATKRLTPANHIELPGYQLPTGETSESIVIQFAAGTLLALQREKRLLRNGQLVEFALVLTDETKDGPIEITCVDSCHTGVVHVHRDNHQPAHLVIMELLSEGDLEKGLAMGLEIIYKAIDERMV